jgi:hypothetical protein
MAAQPLKLLSLLVIWSVCLTVGAPSAAANPPGPAYPAVQAWQTGRLDGVEPTADGALQLAAGRADGWFETAPTPVTPSAVLLIEQRLVQPPTTTMVTAWRSAASAGSGADWSDWQAVPVTPTAAEQRQLLLPLPADALQVQIGVLFLGAADQSPALELLRWRALPALSERPLTAGLPLQPVLNGPPTLTPRPLLIGRRLWQDGLPLQLPPAQVPRRLLVQWLPAPTAGREIGYLRQLRAAQVPQAADISLHYLIAADGRLIEGVAGGPLRAASPVAGDGDVVIGVVPAAAALSDAQLTTLTGLAAWLCAAYTLPDCRIAPALPADALLQRYRIAPPPALPADLPARIAAQQVWTQALFAAGTTVGASQRLVLANPATVPVTVEVQAPDAAGARWRRTLQLPARSRSEVLLEAWLPETSALPMTVTATGVIAVERLLLVEGEREAALGRSAARRWYIADAAVTDGRTLELTLLNPQRGSSDVRLTFITERGVLFEQRLTLAAAERRLIPLETIAAAASAGNELGLIVSSARPIVVERLRRGDGHPAALAGGAVTSQPARSWYFAEGTTENGWRQHLVLLNPYGVSTTVELTLRGENGLIARQRFTLPPLRRRSVDLQQYAAGRGAAVEVQANQPIVAERLLRRTDRAAAALSPGIAAPAVRWLFASVRTRAAEAYLILLNPTAVDAQVTLDLFGEGNADQRTLTVPAGTRRVLALHQQWPERSGAALLVASTAPLVVEQAVLPTGIRGGFTVEQPTALPAVFSAGSDGSRLP